MTICNKIQMVGETMETNLNARGVSCTFGTGTGESTVLDMVEMVNGTNFKGSSDVNLKIGANRPYLLTGETTDVVVKLENGLCEPLTNKNVTIEQSLFRDNGTTSNYSNWDLVASTMQMTRQDTYTELKRKTDASSFGYIVKDLSVTDGITIEFDFKQATPSSSNDQYLSLRNIQGNSRLGISRNYESLNDGEWHHYKLVVNGLTVTPVIDGVQKSDLTLSDSWSRVQLEARNNAVQHFKNFVIYENINGVTDGKGEFALYDVSVTDDTIFNATYGTETATCLVEYCSFVDYGITSKHNDNWTLTSNMQRTRNDSYTTLSSIGSTSQMAYPISNNEKFSGDITIEWDNWATTYQLNYLIIRGTSDTARTFGALGINKVCNVKITVVGTSVKSYIDGVQKDSYTINRDANNQFQVRLQINPSGNDIKYNNFRIR